MRRPVRPAAVAAAVLCAACSAPPAERSAAQDAPPASAAPPLAVHVAVPEDASEAAAAWARALEAAIAARTGDLEVASDAAGAGLVVRVLSVESAPGDTEAPGEGEAFVMRGALVAGETTQEFNLTYRGEARAQAEALARNLHRFGDRMRRGAAPTPPASPSPAG